MLADKDPTKPSMWFCNHNGNFDTTPCIGGKYILENGMIMYNVTGWANFEENKLYVFVDINGERPPNRNGYDLFGFYLEKEQARPACDKNRWNDYIYGCQYQKSVGNVCACWVIEKGNMDYLHKTVEW